MNNGQIRILHHMQHIGPITDRIAREEYGIQRLGARVWELKRDGYDIRDQFVPGVNKYGEKVHFKEYWLSPECKKSLMTATPRRA